MFEGEFIKQQLNLLQIQIPDLLFKGVLQENITPVLCPFLLPHKVLFFMYCDITVWFSSFVTSLCALSQYRDSLCASYMYSAIN